MAAPPVPAPSWGLTARVWWAWTWRWAVWLLVPACVLALLFSAAMPPKSASALLGLLSWPLAIWAQLHALRKVLTMDFGGAAVRITEAAR